MNDEKKFLARGFSPESFKGTLTAEEAEGIARRLIQERFPTCSFAFAGGSIFRGEGTILSDIDLVVIYPSLPQAWRASVIAEGCPVEVFNHDSETLRYFIQKDRNDGTAMLVSMISEGRILPGPTQQAQDLQKECQILLEKRPPPLSQETLDSLRYHITDNIDDLRGHRTHQQIVSIGTVLYGQLSYFIFRTQKQWSGSPKWIPRNLRKIDPTLSSCFDEAFQQLFSGKIDKIIDLASDVLKPYGGFLFEGYTLQAKPEWRIKE